ncbi:MAG: segregation and condensation protein A [Acidimicrobiales bacterium]
MTVLADTSGRRDEERASEWRCPDGRSFAPYSRDVSYTVSTKGYTGPIELLIELVSAQEVDLWQLSLCEIVDQFLAALEELRPALDLEATTEFLVVAALLVELKARRLLPSNRDDDLDDELSVWNERDLLVARLLECRTFRQASEELQRLSDLAGRSLPRCAGLEAPFADLAPDPMEGVSGDRLRRAAEKALEPKPRPQVDISHMPPITLSVADAVTELVEVLQERTSSTFAELARGRSSRLEVVVLFLAVLELYKDGRIDVEQTSLGSDLALRWLGDADLLGDAYPVGAPQLAG